MGEPPFPNEYNLRIVGESDSKSCNVCFKPTTSVLLSSNKVDFFYVCPNHLKDESYAKPIYPDSYNSLIKEKIELQGDLSTLNADLKLVEPYVWNKLMSNIPGFKSKQSTANDKDNNNDDDGDKNKDSGKELEKSTSKSNKEKYEQLKQKIKENNKQLTDIDSKLVNFEFKKFKLNNDIYKIRINNLIQSKFKQKKAKEISTPGFFPSVPRNNLS